MSEELAGVPGAPASPATVMTGIAVIDESSITSQDPVPASLQMAESLAPCSLPKPRAVASEPSALQEPMRRASGKIANLRAAFERKNLSDGSPPRPPPSIINGKRFERSPARGADREVDLIRLKEELDKETETRRIYEEKCLDMQTELARLRDQSTETNGRQDYGEEQQQLELHQEKAKAIDQVSKIQEQLSELQLEKTQLVKETNRLQRNLSEVEHDKARAIEELRDAQRQVSELKRSISAATRMENQISDSTFALEMGTLFHETQNWVVNHFRRAKTDKTATEMCECLKRIAEPTQFERLQSIYEKFDSLDKLAILQTTAIVYMMEIFEEPLLFGLPSQQEWKKGIRRTAEGLPSILTPASFNKWRSSTLDALRNTDSVRDSVNSAAASMAEMICITLTTLTEAEESENRIPSLRTIIGRAIQLSHLFRVQRAQFDFQLPSPGADFNSGTMEEITADGESQSGRTIRCATFPSVTKRGDENGDNLHLTNVISKAKVLCNGT